MVKAYFDSLESTLSLRSAEITDVGKQLATLVAVYLRGDEEEDSETPFEQAVDLVGKAFANQGFEITEGEMKGFVTGIATGLMLGKIMGLEPPMPIPFDLLSPVEV